MKKVSLWIWVSVLVGVITFVTLGCTGPGTTTPTATQTTPTQTTPTQPTYKLGKPVIKFAGLDIVSGRFGDYGRQMIMGGQMAIDEINASGGILGSKVEMNFMDDEFNPDVAVKNARYLFGEWDADFMWGFSMDACTVAVAALLDEYDSILLTAHSCADMTPAYAVKQRRLFVGVMGMDQDAVLPGFYFFREQKRTDIKSWFDLACDYDYGWNVDKIWQATMKKLNPNAVYLGAAGCPYGAVEFTSQLRAMMEKKPSMVVSTPWGGDGAMIIRQAEQMGLFDQDWFKVWWQCMGGSIDIAEGLTDDLKADAFHGKVYGSARYLWNQSSSPQNVKFVEEFRKRNAGRYPNYSAANSYADIMCIKAAIERVGSLDKQALIKDIESHTWQGPEGERSWRVYDHQAQYTVPAGRYTFDAKVAPVAFLTDLSKTPYTTYQRQPPDLAIPN